MTIGQPQLSSILGSGRHFQLLREPCATQHPAIHTCAGQLRNASFDPFRINAIITFNNPGKWECPRWVTPARSISRNESIQRQTLPGKLRAINCSLFFFKLRDATFSAGYNAYNVTVIAATFKARETISLISSLERTSHPKTRTY